MLMFCHKVPRCSQSAPQAPQKNLGTTLQRKHRSGLSSCSDSSDSTQWLGSCESRAPQEIDPKMDTAKTKLKIQPSGPPSGPSGSSRSGRTEPERTASAGSASGSSAGASVSRHYTTCCQILRSSRYQMIPVSALSCIHYNLQNIYN